MNAHAGSSWSRVVTLAREDLRITLRDRSSIFWIFVAPFLWVFFFGFINRPSDPAGTRIGLLVRQAEAGGATAKLTEALSAENFSVVVAGPGEEGPPPGKAPARVLTIPEGFGAAIRDRRKVAVELSTTADASEEGTFAAEVAVHRAVVRLLATEALGDLPPEADAVKVRGTWGGVRPVPSGYHQTVPGNLVMFVLIATTTYGSALLAAERKNGILRRVSISPVRRWELIAGKIGGRLAVALVQVGVFLVLGLFIFRVGWGSSPAGMIVLLLAFVACAAAIGTLGGALFDSPDAASGAGIVLSLVMAALGGCWWPLEVVPAWLRTVALALPTGWAMDGLHQLLSWGGGLRDVLPHCGVLAAVATAAAAGAALRLRAARP